MNEADILELIREHLSISVEKVNHWGYDSDRSTEVTVSLLLSGAVISTESVTIS